MNQIQWEDVFEKQNGSVGFATARAKVLGGWLITHSIKAYNKIATSTCFMPDENHEWVIE